MDLIRIALLAVVLGVVSRTHAQSAPEGLVPLLRRAEVVGAAILRHDVAAAVASDALREQLAAAGDPRITAWITAEEKDGMLVSFIGAGRADESLALYRYDVANSKPVMARLRAGGATPLNEEETAKYRALELAKASGFQSCSPSYNTVVLPVQGEAGPVWAVYLLPGTKQEGLLMVGGIHRIEVTRDGTRIVGSRPFTKTCLRMRNDPRASGLTLTHLLDPAPTEIHVYLSFIAGKTLYVATLENDFFWAIDAGTVRFVKKLEPHR